MICEDCNKDFEMWMTTNEEWNNVIPNVYDNLCIECFKKRALKERIKIDLKKVIIYNKNNTFI